MDSSCSDNIKKIVQNFYDDKDIVDAKKALWNAKGNKLGRYMERNSSENRPAKVPNVQDIFDA